MEKIDFENLTPEQREFYVNEYTRILKNVLDDNARLKKWMEDSFNVAKISNMKVSPLAKILRLLGKYVFNTAVSFTTGIDPIFLDNDVSFLYKSEEDKRKFYLKCNLKKLCYSCLLDQEKGLNKILENLNSQDQNMVNRMLTDINDWEIVLSENSSYPKVNWDGLIAMLLSPKECKVRILGSDVYDKNYILHFYRQTSLGYEYDFLSDLSKMHEEYNNNFGSYGISR